MGVFRVLALAAGFFLLVEILIFGGFHIFVQPSFITLGGIAALACFLVAEMAFLTFK